MYTPGRPAESLHADGGRGPGPPRDTEQPAPGLGSLPGGPRADERGLRAAATWAGCGRCFWPEECEAEGRDRRAHEESLGRAFGTAGLETALEKLFSGFRFGNCQHPSSGPRAVARAAALVSGKKTLEGVQERFS